MNSVLGSALLALMLAGCSATHTAPRHGAHKKPLPPAPPPPVVVEDGPVCAADVQPCADGSYVGRDPAQGCAFRACPAVNNK